MRKRSWNRSANFIYLLLKLSKIIEMVIFQCNAFYLSIQMYNIFKFLDWKGSVHFMVQPVISTQLLFDVLWCNFWPNPPLKKSAVMKRRGPVTVDRSPPHISERIDFSNYVHFKSYCSIFAPAAVGCSNICCLSTRPSTPCIVLSVFVVPTQIWKPTAVLSPHSYSVYTKCNFRMS